MPRPEIFNDQQINMVRCLVDKGDPAEAFEYAEKAKARAFLDLVADADHVLGQKTTTLSDLAREEKKLRDRIVTIQHEAEMKHHLLEEQESTPETEERLVQARGALTRFLSKWFRQEKDFASLRSAKTLTLEESRSILPRDVTLIEYFYADNRLNAWILDTDGFRFK